MKRNLMCLLLALTMVLSPVAFVGCSGDKGDETIAGTTTDESALTTVTLTLWVPTDKDTTEEAILAVQEALSKITKARFETAIELHAVPSDEYEAAIEARMTEIEEAIAFEKAEAERKKKEAKELAAQGITTTAETTAAEEPLETDETYVNEIGMTVVKYPEVEKNQMDIFLIRGYDNYLAYNERGALSALDAELTGTSKILKQYIYPSFIDNAKLNGMTYAIPNNRPLGEYKYLLVNKRLVDELYWDKDKVTTISQCADFIKDVQRFTDVTPFLAPVEPSDVYHWSEDGSWSLIATQLTRAADINAYSPPRSILNNNEYVDTVYLMKYLAETNGFSKDPQNEKEFAVGVISGDINVKNAYEDDYYVYIYETPRATTENIYASMFAVSAYTKSVARSMEVLTMLNTDPELRTILQYGVEGVHWQKNFDNDEVIDILSDDYKMKLEETGNVYMTYPGAGISMEYWESAKQQNLASHVSPYINLYRTDYVTEETKADFDELAKLSKEYYDRIEAMSSEEWLAAIDGLKDEVRKIPVMEKLLSYTGEDSLVVFYNDFSSTRVSDENSAEM
ncbi:MAG: hypothetical protein IKB87_01785 [Clostridia bacterium]|nr:hypothetical protein [Clostridia bacterium]